MTDLEKISVDDAVSLVTDAFAANHVPLEIAASVARALVSAEAEGQVGHGFSRIEDYIAQVRTGKINANANIATTTPLPTSVVTDADFGFAYPALDQSIYTGIEIAKEYGSATMSVFQSHHCGALSVQVDKIARAGLIGLMFANTPKAMAPWGGNTPFFGTNPIAFATPRRDQSPLVVDLSLSKVARGKVMHAKKTGQPIPEGWALDTDGNPTTDPNAALGGSMLPIGDAKGSALALVVEILAAVLTGGATSNKASSFLSPDGPPPGVGQFLIAISPGRSNDAFLDRLETLLTEIIDIENTRLPGTRRASAITSATENGLRIPAHYIARTQALARG